MFLASSEQIFIASPEAVTRDTVRLGVNRPDAPPVSGMHYTRRSSPSYNVHGHADVTTRSENLEP